MSDTSALFKVLAANLGADIAGYSALMGTDEDRTDQDFKADVGGTVPPDEALQVQYARPCQPDMMQRLNSQGYWFGTRPMTMLKREVRANSAQRRAKAEQPPHIFSPVGYI